MKAFLAGTISSVLANIISSSTSQAIGKLRRLNMIELAYRGETAVPKPVQVAAKEISVVIGRAGHLTESFHALLNDLLESGLLAQMALAGLTGISSSGTQSAFNALFQTYFRSHQPAQGGTHLTADKAFGTLTKMLTTSIQNQASLEADEFRSDARFRELRDTVIRTDKVLRSQFQMRDKEGKLLNHEQLAAVRPWLIQSPTLVRETLQAIAESIRSHYEHLVVEGPGEHSVEVTLDNLYVAPVLVPVELTRQATASPFRSRSGGPLTLQTFLLELERAVVVGDPGGGKSTLGQKVCLDLLRSAETGSGPLPIQVVLRKFEAAKAREPQLSLFQYIARNLAEVTNRYLPEELFNPLRNLLTYGRVFLFFDGLDEILAVGKRREFAREVVLRSTVR